MVESGIKCDATRVHAVYCPRFHLYRFRIKYVYRVRNKSVHTYKNKHSAVIFGPIELKPTPLHFPAHFASISVHKPSAVHDIRHPLDTVVRLDHRCCLGGPTILTVY
jgi:hypothetical protein